MYNKVKVTFTQKVKNKTIATPIEFISWNGRPQTPAPVIDYTTRLGGNRYVISTQKTQAAIINSTAVLGAATKAALISTIETIQANLGNRATWTDEEGIVIPNFYIFNIGYNIKKIDGTNSISYIAMCSLSCSTDSTPSSK